MGEVERCREQIAGVSKVLHVEGAGFEHGLAENVAAQVAILLTGVQRFF